MTRRSKSKISVCASRVVDKPTGNVIGLFPWTSLVPYAVSVFTRKLKMRMYAAMMQMLGEVTKRKGKLWPAPGLGPTPA